MKKISVQILTLVIFLTITILPISAATFSDVLTTYLVDGENGTVISADQVTFAINESQSGDSGAIIFTIPKVVTTQGDQGTEYRTPIVNESFGNNTIKFQSGTEVAYVGTIKNAGAIYVDALESGDRYVVTFQASPWDMSNIFYVLWTQLYSYDGIIYVEVTVETQKATDQLIFEYLTGNYNSPEISKGNEEIGGALDALNPLVTDFAQAGEELNNYMNNVMNSIKNNAGNFKTPIGKLIGILGVSLTPLFNDGILFFLIMISVLTIVIIAVLRKAGD